MTYTNYLFSFSPILSTPGLTFNLGISKVSILPKMTKAVIIVSVSLFLFLFIIEVIFMYGKKFKEIRIKQNISLEQAAKDVVSISTLSRWENDKLDINFSQLNHLLANIHLTLREFARYCEINPSDTFSIKAAKAYNSDDINQLHALAQQQLDKYYSSRDRYDLFLTAIANNYYFDLTQKNIFSQEDINRLNYLFSHVEYWSEFYITVFANNVFLIKPEVQYQICNKILSQLYLQDFSSWDIFIDSIGSILNSLTSLIISNPSLAQKLLEKINKLPIPIQCSYMKIRRNFLDKLLHYRLNKDNENEILNIISSLKTLGLPQIAHNFSTLFTRIKDL